MVLDSFEEYTSDKETVVIVLAERFIIRFKRLQKM